MLTLLSRERFLQQEPMRNHTTFKIGGPADYLILPSSLEELTRVIEILKRYDVPHQVLGNGSNILVLDGGIRGGVIKFESAMAYMRREGKTITVGAGALLKDVAAFAADEELTGLEFACGIPGSVGGAVFMNAGAYEGETKDVVARVRAVTSDGKIVTYAGDALRFGYRKSIFQKTEEIIAEVDFVLRKGERKEILAKMEQLQVRRESRQPLEMPSAGSTFKRPTGHFAGTLIEETGLKGFSVGGAQISMKHAGFVVNKGDATAKDVLTLIEEVQKRVYNTKGVKLHPEVRIIGER
ncbi:UDP-N-acetylmuramate dehydrogenase [Selenomonas sp. TAMA-11512]|uniref:UDP-N-acetylmuramate dehydrogenase n=1 Tax=Selenomonas sp. TAMA-11512 TaxID=3095337 RepID=UPI0030CB3DEF